MSITNDEFKQDSVFDDFSSPTEEELAALRASETGTTHEEKSVSDDQYAQKTKERKSNFQGHVHILSTVALYIVFGVYTIAILIWLMHFLLPEYIGSVKLHYLPEEDFNKLQGLLFGTLVGGVANQFSKKVFDD